MADEQLRPSFKDWYARTKYWGGTREEYDKLYPKQRHIHKCALGLTDEGHDGHCQCSCGATLEMGPTYRTDGLWAWHLPDGTWANFPDPLEDQA